MSAAKDSLRGYNGGMVLRRTPHAVYDTLYHVVWSPKYRRDVLQGEIQQRVQELFADIAEQYDITIEEMEVSPDRAIMEGVTFFLQSYRKAYSATGVVQASAV